MPDLRATGLHNLAVESGRGPAVLTLSTHNPKLEPAYQGPARDGRIVPHVVAPGYISNARATGEACEPNALHSKALIAREGSSVAAAAVAGMVALVRRSLVTTRYKPYTQVP